MAQGVKNLPAMQETRVWSLGQENPLEKGMATHSSILAWKILWTEEPGGLQSMGSQRVRHDWVTNTHTHTHTPDLILSLFHLPLISQRYSLPSFPEMLQKLKRWLSQIVLDSRTLLVVQRLRLCAPSLSLFPGQGTRPHMPQLRLGVPK